MAQVFLVHGDRLQLAGVVTRLGSGQSSVGSGQSSVDSGQSSVISVGDRPQLEEACTRAVGDLCRLAVQDGQPVVAGEIDGLRSLAALPLRSGNTIIGALALGALEPDAFADRLGFTETIAGLLAVRLQNTLLHQELQERAAGLEETVIERTRELQAERDRTQAILDTVGESVVVTDPDGQVLFANPATAVLTGAARDDALGRPLWHRWTQQSRTEMPARGADCAARRAGLAG